jgi:hypothetical protein
MHFQRHWLEPGLHSVESSESRYDPEKSPDSENFLKIENEELKAGASVAAC